MQILSIDTSLGLHYDSQSEALEDIATVPPQTTRLSSHLEEKPKPTRLKAMHLQPPHFFGSLKLPRPTSGLLP